MMRARVVALALVGAVLLAPFASAQTFDGRLRNPQTGQVDCTGLECVRDALLGVVVSIFSAIGLGLALIFNVLFSGFASGPLKAMWDAFTGALGGIGASLGELFGSFGNGARNAFGVAYQNLADSLSWFGPLAPLVAAGVILGVIALVLWVVSLVIDRANDPLPGPVERLVDTDDEDDDDDDGGR